MEDECFVYSRCIKLKVDEWNTMSAVVKRTKLAMQEIGTRSGEHTTGVSCTRGLFRT